MGNSFKDQFLKLGLVDKKQVEKANKAQHQQKKKKTGKKQPPPVDENKLLAEQAQAKKRERARQLNLEREEKLRKREELAKIRQMIEDNRLEKDDRGIAYRFADKGKIFRVFVAQQLADQLGSGAAGIVRLGNEYEVVPASVARKLKEQNEEIVVVLNVNTSSQEASEDDPYASYEVPDDLMW